MTSHAAHGEGAGLPNPQPARQIGVFARVPRAGAVKTRLAWSIGPGQAAELYAAFLGDTVEICRRVCPHGTWLFVAPEDAPEDAPEGGSATDPGAELDPSAPGPPSDFALPPERVRAQEGADLGERMARALETMLAHGPAVVVGSDAPDLPEHFLEAAFESLVARDLVLGPTADGGYYLVGTRRPVGALFKGIAWSTPEVLGQTRAAAAALGLSTALLPLWRDVDVAEDLAGLRERLSEARARGAAIPARTARLVLDSRPGSAP